MRCLRFYHFTLLSLLTLASAIPFASVSTYAPTAAQCPVGPLVRKASNGTISLNPQESAYRDQRTARASDALRKWLGGVIPEFAPNGTFSSIKMPVVALASSGGSVRALLSGAGVIQALDDRDPVLGDRSLAGIYQGVTYHSGTAAGAWLVAALAGNDGATIHDLILDKWIGSFADASFIPPSTMPKSIMSIMTDVVAKAMSGCASTLVDTWGRMISLHLQIGNNAGLSRTLSGVMKHTDFRNHDAPYPIITALAVDPATGRSACIHSGLYSPQYEFHPFEFGSWDPLVRAFSQTQYMGSMSSGGMTLSGTACVNGFDNWGLLVGSSSNMFNLFCSVIPDNRFSGDLGQVENNVISMTEETHPLTFYDEYGIIPNPFVSTASKWLAPSPDNLYLVDGSQGGESLPLWPLIQLPRIVDVIIANDNSADTEDFYPNGTALYNTYKRSLRLGLKTMPVVPPPDVFVQRNLTDQPVFFGCNDPTKITIIYLPNGNRTVADSIPDWTLQYNSSEVLRTVANGYAVATMDSDDAAWPQCLGCGLTLRRILNSDMSLPAACRPCLDQFCYQEE